MSEGYNQCQRFHSFYRWCHLRINLRPPSSSNLSQFYEDLSAMFIRIGDVNFVACSDFSCGGMDLTSMRAGITTLFDMNGLWQYVSNSVRTMSTSSSLLDLVINSTNCKHVSMVVYDQHTTILFQLDLSAAFDTIDHENVMSVSKAAYFHAITFEEVSHLTLLHP